MSLMNKFQSCTFADQQHLEVIPSIRDIRSSLRIYYPIRFMLCFHAAPLRCYLIPL